MEITPQAARQKVFIIDDNATSLTSGRNLLKPFYEVYLAKSAAEFFLRIKNNTPDLILLDIEMPDMNGYETIQKLKADSHYADIPVIFLTTKSDEGSELKGLALGAVDYVSKPFSPPLLKKRIENHLLIYRQQKELLDAADHLSEQVREKTQEVFDLQNAILNTVADLVEFRDKFTGGHITRTQLYVQTLLRQLIKKGVYTEIISNWNMNFILPSAQLHDVGKIAIPDNILNKPGRLTPEEFEVIKTHVTIGAAAVRHIMDSAPEHEFLRHALNITSAHHEKWDGTGYAEGMKGQEIPLEGRLMAIADVYDALVSWRPYKSPMSPAKAAAIIKEGSGTHFDPTLVEIFKDVEKKFAAIASEKVAEDRAANEEAEVEAAAAADETAA